MTRRTGTLVELLAIARPSNDRRARVHVPGRRGDVKARDSPTPSSTPARARSPSALREHGVRPGDRALLIYPPSLDFIPAFFGCLYAGVIAVPAYPPQPAQASRTLPRLLSIVGDADVSIVLSNTAVADGAANAPHAPALDAVPWLCTETVATQLADVGPPIVGDDPLAFLQYTSGSTASPKGVMVSHGNLLHNLAYASHAAENDAATVSVSWLPVIHDMGLIEGVLASGVLGISGVPHGARLVSSAPDALASRDHALPGDDERRAELRLRPLRSQNHRRAARRARSVVVAHRVQRRRADQRATRSSPSTSAFATSDFAGGRSIPVYGLAESTLLVSTGGRRLRAGAPRRRRRTAGAR